MCSSIDEKRLSLQEKIEAALEVLINQTLVSKKGDTYIFLTNEEQAINKEIERQDINIANVREELGKLVFEDIMGESKYKYPLHNGRYVFEYTQKIDEQQHSNREYPVTLQLLTPYSDAQRDDASLHMLSSQTPGVLIVLPDRSDYLEEIRRYLKTEKFLRLSSLPNFQNAGRIKSDKQNENNLNRALAKTHLQTALEDSRILVNGTETLSSGKDIKSRIRSALETAIHAVYHKLSYITAPMDASGIKTLFSPNTDQLIPSQNTDNKDAVRDVVEYIRDVSGAHQKVSMKRLQDRFMAPPYGFVELDVEWIAARLLKNGDINAYINGQQLLLQEKDPAEMTGYFSKKQYADSLLIEIRQKANETQLEILRKIIKELYNDSAQNDDEDTLVEKFKTKTRERIEKLEKYEREYGYSPKFPGKDTVSSGLTMLRKIAAVRGTLDFFDEVKDKKEDLLNFAEAFSNIDLFFTGAQKEIFAESLRTAEDFEQNKNFIENKDIPAIAGRINEIIGKQNPYRDISRLPELNAKYRDLTGELCEKEREPLLEILEDAKKTVFKELAGKDFGNDFNAAIVKSFEDEAKKIKSCSGIFEMKGIKYEIDQIKINALNKISAKQDEIAAKKNPSGGPGPEAPEVKKTKRISIKSLSPAASWRLESAEDVETCITRLRNRLLQELDDDTILSVEF
jgi:hypothetical protein